MKIIVFIIFVTIFVKASALEDVEDKALISKETKADFFYRMAEKETDLKAKEFWRGKADLERASELFLKKYYPKEK